MYIMLLIFKGDAPKRKIRKVINRQAWSVKEEDEIKVLFSANFKGKKYPGLKDCTAAMASSKRKNGLIHRRNWETTKKKVIRMIKNLK